jgi:hypothetical protein
MAGLPLTPREQQFVAEFLVDRNGAAAARRAGYATRSAKVTAARLLTKANIRMAIAEGTQAAIERTEINADWLTDRYRNAHDGAMAAGQFSAAVKALDSLAKLKGLALDQRLIHAGDAGQPLAVQVTANHVHDLPPDGAAAVFRILADAGALAPGVNPAGHAADAMADPPPANG